MISCLRILLIALLFSSQQVSADLIGISDCGIECDKTLHGIGNYLETQVNGDEIIVSLWSKDNKPIKSCLNENIINSGSWDEYGEDGIKFRRYIERLVFEYCVKPMLGHTNITVVEMFLEKEAFLDPSSGRSYGLVPLVIPKGSYLNQVWLRVRVKKSDNKVQSDTY
jgi:hypothetical protein